MYRLRRATLLYAQDFYEMTGEPELKEYAKMKPEKILNYVMDRNWNYLTNL